MRDIEALVATAASAIGSGKSVKVFVDQIGWIEIEAMELRDEGVVKLRISSASYIAVPGSRIVGLRVDAAA